MIIIPKATKPFWLMHHAWFIVNQGFLIRENCTNIAIIYVFVYLSDSIFYS